MAEAKRVVVKIGSSLLTEESGRLSRHKLNTHVWALARAVRSGSQVVFVSSGAIAAGFERLGYSERPDNVAAKQASAAVGQGLLMQAYADAFGAHNLTVAQVLLTRKDFSERESYNNALNALELLLQKGVIPIINENDTVSLDEKTFGDNDMLSALVAALVHADSLIILTDAAGLYKEDPRKNPNAEHIPHVSEITSEILQLASGDGSRVGTGGMYAKIKAAECALSMGVRVFIGCGTDDSDSKVVAALHGSGRGTYFTPDARGARQRRKQWLAFHSDSNGQIVVDSGAKKALIEGGKSLLPAGVVEALGDFKKGDVVKVVSAEGEFIGKGVCEFSAVDVNKVKGKSSSDACSILDIRKGEVIHRDNWVGADF